ncbi:MAG: hypothetical protein GWM98_10320, partial [Nitrospinaceae bacterium]|nr:hypothetical protein [Nitrospinaceae bacterium]NIR54811.1 hypothetical protein [Nitrospinaceae bacterium]NIS85236.1 hypothetical protein [Nitrospinaceae bacterium]NIT82049.1 hypothetical protein [Nitrospinaceae bacterium]NIU44310.1 hypothetical protein [Nitrospinaceae bacterium]
VGYDLDHNGRPDFYTVRVVVVHFFSMEPLEQIAKYHPGLQVFQVVYPYASYFYVTQSQPLFYAVDEDEDGRWDTVFKDIQEDGINGNEVAWNNVAFHANR